MVTYGMNEWDGEHAIHVTALRRFLLDAVVARNVEKDFYPYLNEWATVLADTDEFWAEEVFNELNSSLKMFCTDFTGKIPRELEPLPYIIRNKPGALHRSFLVLVNRVCVKGKWSVFVRVSPVAR